MQEKGIDAERSRIAEYLRNIAIQQYNSRSHGSADERFGAMKLALDEGLNRIRTQGQAGIADRIMAEIVHSYNLKHRRERIPAFEAMKKAADEVLDKFARGQIL